MSAKLKNELKKSYTRHLTRSLAKRPDKATGKDRYMALALSVRDLMVEKWISTAEAYEEKNPKSVYYLSLEYLIGRTLGNAMINLEVEEDAKQAMRELGHELEDIREEEIDAGLGNGGLGRLAACFLDSMATLDLPALGYGIRYDYGIFEQIIVDGYQVEEPDHWLRFGNPWEIRRNDRSRVVHFHGRTKPSETGGCPRSREWIDTEDVLALPYDTPIPGYRTDNVNTLRLWSAQSLYGFNLKSFNQGDYLNANLNQSLTENITKVLYPNDNNYEGKELRLKQQYFLVSATLQDILSRFKSNGGDVHKFHEKAIIQLNDTHPAFAIPELMRLLLDSEKLDWDEAWSICEKTFNYTNHTLMGEALERWPVPMVETLLPRIMEIIYEINAQFLRNIANRHPGDMERIRRMSLIEEGPEKKVRMAYMSIIGSSRVNGVAALHTELLKNGLFKDFHDHTPGKFVNVTNGITPRRWLRKANPRLSEVIIDRIGEGWVKDLSLLKEIEAFAADENFQNQVNKVKRDNKADLADHILAKNGLTVDPGSIFDVQVKRLHEYKRQLMNILRAISLYLDIKDDPGADVVPRTIIFSAKAAPGYHMAKMIIKLINSVAEVVNSDPQVGEKLRIVFLANYRVSLAEKIIPAADLSEQISLAGTEASGTGNMKFALNGALTIGTLDGANIEIKQAVGDENIFIFGLKVEDVERLREEGYDPRSHVEKAPKLKRVLELIENGFFSQCEPDLFQPIMDAMNRDVYMVGADFNAYLEAHEEAERAFQDPSRWAGMAIANIANMGWFSSDRTISEYARNIWNIHPFKV